MHRGHAHTVVDVAIWHLHAPQALAAMAAAYRFPLAAIYAAMAYYDDHQREVNTRLRNDEAFARELQREVPSRLPAMPRTPPRA